MSFVLDNSVSMRWYFGDGSVRDLAYANRVLDVMENSKVIVPATWGLEVGNVIARSESKSLVTIEASNKFIEMIKGADITVDAHTFEYALTRNLELARTYKLTAYDASYLELALRLRIPLATLDENLRKAAKKSGVKIFD